MERRSWFCHVVVLALLGSGGLVIAQDQPTTAAAPAPHLKLSSQEWNFGSAWQGQLLKGDIRLTNVGQAPLEITDVRPSCGCTVATKPKSPLAPGESDTMTLSYDGAHRLGAAHQTVTLITNDPTQPSVAIRLAGEVKALFAIEPSDGLVFAKLLRSSLETRTVEITNQYTEKMFLKLKDGQDFGPFQIELREIEPGMRYSVTATTRPPLKVDRYQPNVELLTGLELVPEIKVLVYGFVQPPVDVRPAKLFLPQNSVSPMKRVLRVLHTEDYPVRITAVRSTDAAVKVALEPPQPGPDGKLIESYQITVTLPPGDLVALGGEPAIEITTSAPDPEFQKLVVPIQVVQPAQPSSAPSVGPHARAAPTTTAGPHVQQTPSSQSTP
jgi:hypothetical protein